MTAGPSHRAASFMEYRPHPHGHKTDGKGFTSDLRECWQEDHNSGTGKKIKDGNPLYFGFGHPITDLTINRNVMIYIANYV
ncbi:hypothetical protein [Novacetimonas hansenii]|uniref:hypothetical protein n=1 Tax=Novacetimonas hansenii TaxID=436 RepID=UPI00248EDB52|nr:hypothetical protein [Novacetimonas hansenii]